MIPYYERFMARFPTCNPWPSTARRGAASLDRIGLLRARAQFAQVRESCGDSVRRRISARVGRADGLARHRTLNRGGHSGVRTRSASADSRWQRQARAGAGVWHRGRPEFSKPVIDALWAQSDACTPAREVAAYTQAIMDLGATCARAPDLRALCVPCMTSVSPRSKVGKGNCRAENKNGSGPSREATLLIAHTGRKAQPPCWCSAARRRACGVACGRRRNLNRTRCDGVVPARVRRDCKPHRCRPSIMPLPILIFG